MWVSKKQGALNSEEYCDVMLACTYKRPFGMTKGLTLMTYDVKPFSQCIHMHLHFQRRQISAEIHLCMCLQCDVLRDNKDSS